MAAKNKSAEKVESAIRTLASHVLHGDDLAGFLADFDGDDAPSVPEQAGPDDK